MWRCWFGIRRDVMSVRDASSTSSSASR
jgi:hypothetical protein